MKTVKFLQELKCYLNTDHPSTRRVERLASSNNIVKILKDTNVSMVLHEQNYHTIKGEIATFNIHQVKRDLMNSLIDSIYNVRSPAC